MAPTFPHLEITPKARDASGFGFERDGLRERSHRPLVSPNATKAEVVGKIIHLRQHYHFGPGKISMYLKLFNTKLTEWERFYNFARPHGALGGVGFEHDVRQQAARGGTR
jgi:transposase InsO family protein